MNGMCPLIEYNNMMLGIGLIGINEKELVVISVTCDICLLKCDLQSVIVGRAVWP